MCRCVLYKIKSIFLFICLYHKLIFLGEKEKSTEIPEIPKSSITNESELLKINEIGETNTKNIIPSNPDSRENLDSPNKIEKNVNDDLFCVKCSRSFDKAIVFNRLVSLRKYWI